TRFSRDWSSDVCSSDLNSNLPMRRRVLMEMVSVGPYIYAIGGDDKPWYTYMRRDAWVSPDGVDWMKLREKGNLGQRSRLDWETQIGRASCRERVGSTGR